MKNFICQGEIIPFIATAAYTSGQVVRVGAILGVNSGPVAIGETGQLVTEGVFECPKATTAVITQGAALQWDAATAKFTTTADAAASGDVTGPGFYAFQAAGNGATTVQVRFTGVPGTVTP